MDNSNQKLKIAMLGQKTIPAKGEYRGGVEVVVEELSTRMAVLGNQVTCYNRYGCDNGNLKDYKGVNLKTVFTVNRKGLAAMTSSFFAAIYASFRSYDVVHFHAEGPCFFLWIPKLFHKRCIVTIHGLDWQREKWGGGFGSKFIKWGEKMAVRYADEIIVLSKNVQEYFQKTYGRKTAFIPNGVNRPTVREANVITEKYGLKKDNYILYLGRIVPEKGLTYLVEAYKRLKTDKKLVIAGGNSDTGDYIEEIKSMCSNDNGVIFTGAVAGRLLEELYSNAYLYCLPSDLEGMPLTLLEAMSYGNCCVVSDIAECTEVVENKAVVFQKGNVEDLAEKLQDLSDNVNLVNQYKNQSADFICNKYNWDKVTEETLSVYQA